MLLRLKEREEMRKCAFEIEREGLCEKVCFLV